MKKLFVIVLTIFVLATCGSPSTLDVVSTPTTADEFLHSFIGEGEPGAIVVVVKDGEIQDRAAYGLANLKENQPLTMEHMMHLASVGKQMTALGIMLLAKDGLLDYDDPVGKHIPELAHFGNEFTIRHLLTHTSGLPDYEDDLLDALFARSQEPDNEDLIAVLSDWEGPQESPGEVFEYSNPGYELLGAIAARVSGMSFPDFMEKRIFDPLGMKQTFSLPNKSRRADPLVAMSYTDEDGSIEPYPSDPLDNLLGSGSIYTTAGDMALYDEALYRGTLISTSALEEAFQPVKLNDGSVEPYGFGWELESWNGKPYVAHSGAWLGFESDYVRFLERHFSVLVMLNRNYNIPDEPRIALQVAEFYLKPSARN